MTTWSPGDVVVLRDVSRGVPWVAHPVYVVDDSADLLVTYTPEGAPFGFLPNSDHPWSAREAWEGHGVLVLRRPGDAYSVWHFWTGGDRRFAAWYVNLEAPFARTAIGIDVSDRELDIVVAPDGSWSYKDWELLDDHVQTGRYTRAQVAAIRSDGEALVAMLDGGAQWWDDRWVAWTPPASWTSPRLRDDWADVPVAVAD